MIGANSAPSSAGRPQLAAFVVAVPYCCSAEDGLNVATPMHPSDATAEMVNCSLPFASVLFVLMLTLAGLAQPVVVRMPVVFTVKEAFTPG